MALLDWAEDYRTGIDYVDREHRKLVDIINRISETLSAAESEKAVTDCLGQIYAEVSAHFALLEKLMRENDFAHYAAHKANHEKLLEEMRAMMDAYDNGVCNHCGETLDHCLRAWFRKQFQVEDARLETMRR